jgi:hypothetical protein
MTSNADNSCMDSDGRNHERTAALLGQVAGLLADQDVACYVRPGQAGQLPVLRGDHFMLGWRVWQGLFVSEELPDQFAMIHWPSQYGSDGFRAPFSPSAVGPAGAEDPARLARAAAAVLAGESEPESSLRRRGIGQVLELLGTFIGGSFAVPFMSALGQAAGQDAYQALKKRLSVLQAKASPKQDPAAEDAGTETVITDPGTGTQLIVISGGTVDDVARALATFTTRQIAGKKLVWRQDTRQFEIDQTDTPMTG